DREADEFYYLLRSLIMTLKQMDSDSTVYYQLLNLADTVYGMISLTGTELFPSDISAASACLREGLKELRDDVQHSVRCLGHTHIDIAWLWTLDHTREKAQRSFATVLRLMERYPDYVFFQSQPYLYARLKEDAPDLYKQIKARIDEGRWEPNGGMWVEADCLLTGGESLARQFLYGKEYFRDELGVESDILWLPDVFGYTASLPQVMRLSEVPYFMTTKISWNQYNRIPNDTFTWRGIDGSEVLTHFINTPGVNDDQDLEDLNFYTYNGMVNANSVNGIWKSYQNKDFSNELLISYGYGDGGGGVTRGMLETIPALDKIPGNPKLKTGTASEFFRKLDSLQEKKGLNTWEGELYLEFHRGTYTSQSRTKRYNRKLEFALRNTEILSLITGKAADHQKDLEVLWKELLTRQFHDILPGSSITEVYEEAEAAYARIEADLEGRRKEFYAQDAEGSFAVFNPQSFNAAEVVYVPEVGDGEFTMDGKTVPAQKAADASGYYLQITGDAMSIRSLTFAAGAPTMSPGKSREVSEIQSFFYNIKWDENGSIVSLYDRTEESELIAEGKRYNRLSLFEDSPRHFDAWELEPYYEEKRREIGALSSARIIEDGPLIQIVEFKWEIGQSTITQNMKMYAHSRRIDFETSVHWHERKTLLRTYFETDILSSKARYDIQFGNVERSTHSNTSWDFARFEVPAQKWADFSQRGKGLALMNDCKYGYNVKEGVIGLSLLKSPVVPDSTADQGEHKMSYSILPHSGDFYEADVERESLMLNNPFQVFEGSSLSADSLVSVDAKNVVVDAVKLSQDGKSAVVRMHEYAGMKSDAALKTSLPVSSWQEVNILEHPAGRENDSDRIELEFSPYEIKTVSIRL
ncbi:MAG: glycoside hydrolase family 38 C-terminal domain-containing protein, partial [Spirochaetales bacterium]|nr:glycoside hydrolase family 38 C-terminal domain-containing protein [Spirochaetales bacterium]